MSVRRASASRQTPETAPVEDEDELNTEFTPVRGMSSGSSTKSTPYSRLRQLAGAFQKPTTPQTRGRGPSLGATSARRDERTPASQGGRTPALNRPPRPVPVRPAKPTTPHAIRALQQRKAAAALTPGRERRRSGRVQRETPQDILKQLSRVEKTRSRTLRESEPSKDPTPRRVTATTFAESDSEDEPRPNLTMPLDDDDDEDYAVDPPPRLSQAFDEDDTQRSIEGPRRDFAGLGRRPSADLRRSEHFGDLDDLGPQVGLEDEDEDTMDVDAFRGGEMDLGDQTGELRGVLEAGRQSLRRDPSFGVISDAENSFAFNLPPAEEVEAEPASEAESDAEPLPEDTETANVSIHIAKPSAKKSKVLNQSRYGIAYPSLPAGVVKRLTAAALKSSGNSKTRVNRQILAAVMQASDWFFEQIGEDLEAYANHAKRKTIDESDVVTLMKRQRILNASTTPFSIAEKQLPRELLQDLRMVQQPKMLRKLQPLDTIAEESD